MFDFVAFPMYLRRTMTQNWRTR